MPVGRWPLLLVRGRGKSEHHKAACRGKTRGGLGRKFRSMESVTENRPPRRARSGVAVRVKRRGKSPPPGGQPPGHDKPHAVQGQTETPGRLPGRGEPWPVSGIGRMRVARRRWRGAIRARDEWSSPGRLSQAPRNRIRLTPATTRGASGNRGAPRFFSAPNF